MKNLKKKISRSFDRGSKFYEFNSDIQKNICLELINFYKNLKINRDRMKFENALDIGCGSGFMTNQINRLENFSKIHLIDISKKMISKAKQNLSNEKFSFEVADFDNFKCYGIYDLVFSNMSLHWSGNFTKLFFNLLNQIPCGGSFIFSIPNSIKFDFESSEISKDFFEKLINMLPDSDDLNRMIDKDKFYFLSKKKVFSEKFKKPLDFFLNLKSIGANINLKKTKINLFFLRRMTSEIKINYHVSFFFIKKIKE